MEESGQLHISAALPLMLIKEGNGWVPEPVWILCQKKIPPTILYPNSFPNTSIKMYQVKVKCMKTVTCTANPLHLQELNY
jgi:hypothetical protein